jgi:AcrR family transcriptional regulator
LYDRLDMGISERKERQKAELREQILGAARRIALDEGFDAMTMRKIADAIEYSPATIYLHFENREAIGRELCAEAFGHLVAHMTSAAGGIADPAERLLAIGKGYARFGFENPKEYKLIFMTDSVYMEAMFGDGQNDPNDPGERAFQFLVDTVQECIACGAIAPADPLLVAEMVWTGVHGVVSMALTCHQVIESPVERLVDTMCATMMRGLSAAPAHVAAAPTVTS